MILLVRRNCSVIYRCIFKMYSCPQWTPKQFQLHTNNKRTPENVKRMKLYKTLFSTILFGTTLSLVIYVKGKRSAELRHVLEDARRLPIDDNYLSSMAHHMYAYHGFVLHLDHIKAMQHMSSSFEAKHDDIYVVSFPKSGTTWVQEIVYLIGNDLNYKKAASQIMETRFPYLEYVYPGWQSIEKLNSTRYIKSHLPYSLLPTDIKEKNCKIIYVARNPKDVLVSYYFYVRMHTFSSYRGSLKEFLESFLKNEVFYAPFWNHVLQFWERRQDDNILFIKYEDLQKDLQKEIKKIATFLGKCLSEEEIESLAKHVSFDVMITNPSVNYSHWDDLGLRHKEECQFLRQGKTGDWKNYLLEDMNSKVNDWITRNTTDTDLKFEYE